MTIKPRNFFYLTPCRTVSDARGVVGLYAVIPPDGTGAASPYQLYAIARRADGCADAAICYIPSIGDRTEGWARAATLTLIHEGSGALSLVDRRHPSYEDRYHPTFLEGVMAFGIVENQSPRRQRDPFGSPLTNLLRPATCRRSIIAMSLTEQVVHHCGLSIGSARRAVDGHMSQAIADFAATLDPRGVALASASSIGGVRGWAGADYADFDPSFTPLQAPEPPPLDDSEESAPAL